MAVKAIPDGFHAITPYLIIKGAAAAIDFYKRAFGATELMRLEGPNGTIGHAEILLGNSPVMLADEHPPMGYTGPQHYGGSPVSLMFYVEDVDAMFDRAVSAGAKVKQPVKDQFYGDRTGTLEDPFGHVWSLGTHKEDLSPEEINRRHEEMMKKSS